MKMYLEEKIDVLKEFKGHQGQELLSNRLQELIQSLDFIQAIWLEIATIFRPSQ